MNRRDFLLFSASGLASIGTQTFAKPAHLGKQDVSGRYIFSANNQGGKHYLSRIDLFLKTKTDQAIPFRAHDVLWLNNQSIIGFGRRPGFFCAKVDFGVTKTQVIEATTGRHFYGHGCLSADLSLLFTTENDFVNAQGVIGVRDAKTLKPLGDFSSYGIGPHDIHLLPDNKTLVVANGGIQTHPDYGRRKLNLKTMQPSLVYIDAASGKKLAEYRLNDHLLSIRHLTVTAQGDIGVAMQYQGDIYRQQPQSLVAWQPKNETLTPLNATGHTLEPYRGYMADLAYDSELQLLAVTAPRGNQITFWDAGTRDFCYDIETPEPSGIHFLAHQKRFLVSNAKGQLLSVSATKETADVSTVTHYDNTQWDNHFIVSE